MSVLANEVYEYLLRTGIKVNEEDEMTRHKTTRKNVRDAFNELLAAGKIIKDRVRKAIVYYAPEAKPEVTNTYVPMRPYEQPTLLTQRQREIEAQRAAFPSKFS